MELVGMARACEDILRNREKERILGRTEGRREGKREGERSGIIKGRREGERYGIIKGKRESEKYMIRKMLENDESIEKIQLYSNCSIKQINKIKNELQ